jgi:hypothetical protein
MPTRTVREGESLTSIEDFAASWGVTPKTVQNWVEFTYQAFEIPLPSSGPFPEWGVQLLNGCAKHVSERASLYFAETGERRRLKGTEYVRKVRTMRAAGQFAEYDPFRNVQNFSALGNAADLENEVLGELGAITRESDTAMARIKDQVERREDEQVEELAQFLEGSDRRKMAKLLQRLRQSQPSEGSVQEAIDVAYQSVQPRSLEGGD